MEPAAADREIIPLPAPLLMASVASDAPVIAPLMVRAEPLAPVPSTLHVCAAPRTTGALMVTAPALAPTEMPADESEGVMVRLLAVPPTPEAMVTMLTPVGAPVKFKALIA